MMTTHKITKITIHHVSRIVISDVQEQIKDEFSDRILSIETMDGEEYQISLWAYTPDKLEIKEEGKNDWLSPKVYKGKSMAQLGEEED
jgi:hypothetical protein